MRRSDSVSSADVASSRISTGASFSSARAIAIALPLAAREHRAALADSRLEPLRQLGRELRHVRGLGGAPRSPRAARPRARRTRCCSRCCRRTARRPGSRGRAAGAGRAADTSRTSRPSSSTAPAVGLVEPRQQARDRRLAAARLADERDGRARLERSGSRRAARRACRRRRRTRRPRYSTSPRARPERRLARVALSPGSSRISNNPAAAVMPRCTTALTLIKRLSGVSTMPIAVTKPMNAGAFRSENDRYITAATPSATA